MKSHPLTKTLALILIFLIVVPSELLIAPRKAHAVIPVQEVGFMLPESIITAIKTTISAMEAPIATAATVALEVDKYVLEPLAFIESGILLKAMTASVISFVDGQSNGTGAPQFVQNLQGNLQNLGDTQAFSFFTQFGQNSSSPFASAIISSLRSNYLHNTSFAGFFAANQCTLSQSSPNENAFLAGNWAQGGTGAWFALTTQNQNNPYTLYQGSQSELSATIADAANARQQELGWGNGFLSWCGNNPASGTGAPADSCVNSDGTPGTIETPGSVITSWLNTNIASPVAKLVQMGSVGPEINSILGNVATVVGTVGFATQLLGGPGSGGLFGATQPGSTGISPLSQYRNSPGYFGTTQQTTYQGAATLPSSGQNLLNLVNQYRPAWNTISAAANTASTSVTNLASYCATQITFARSQLSNMSSSSPTQAVLTNFIATATAQINATQTALLNEIAPVFAQAATAFSNISAAVAMIQKVQNELTSNSPGAAGVIAADLQTLQTMPPTATDVANAQQQALSSGTAVANPSGSLSVSANTLVDQMNLISTNAQALMNSCTAP